MDIGSVSTSDRRTLKVFSDEPWLCWFETDCIVAG